MSQMLSVHVCVCVGVRACVGAHMWVGERESENTPLRATMNNKMSSYAEIHTENYIWNTDTDGEIKQ